MKAFFSRIGRKTWIAIAAVLVIVIVVAVLNARARSSSTSQYQTQPARRGDLVASVGATGSVRAMQSAVLNWQVTGTVDTGNVQAGDHVNKGAVRASLANTSVPAAVITAEASLITAKKAMDDLLHSD